MLTIQRASAGSGKTYTLARKFILNILAFQTESGSYRLRNEKQMEDALSHILAITFTNKATNEMKQRIVNNLSLLSKAAYNPITEELLKSTPYLKEFQQLTQASYQKIGEAAEEALKVILNNYSRFKISTIDSFFQEILRTFTYEANINESYQLELDSSFVTDAALDSAINELDTHPHLMGNAAFWLKTLMREESKKTQKWNLFNKRATSGSIYSRIKFALNQLEKEEFKEVKNIIDSYFSIPENISSLHQLYVNLSQKADEERDNLLKALKKQACDAQGVLMKYNLSEKEVYKNFIKHLNEVVNLKPSDKFTKSFTTFTTGGTVFKKGFKTEGHPLDAIAMEMYRLLDLWNNPPFDSYIKNRDVYGPLIPLLGLIAEVKTFLSQVLENNNLIQISETGYILKKIIGEDDAPFVFERLGNKIDHYLIDEFQDTSRMQWDVIHPLLKEGVSKDKESLIIGDPKQSIYRFRNADHKLITHVVPETFPHLAAGYSKEENTNWRSHSNIVKFNNYFFKTLAEDLTSLSAQKGGNTDFTDLYSNVVQYASNGEDRGYVEAKFFRKPDGESKDSSFDDDEAEDEEGSKKGWFEKMALNNLVILIEELIERGYRPRDIGVLVTRNDQGKDVISAIMNHNDKLTDKNKKIDFISEESLLVSSSQTVQIILGVLEKLTYPGTYHPQEEKKEEDDKPIYRSWNKIKIDYSIYSNNHQEEKPVNRLYSFLNEEGYYDSLPELLNDLSTPSLSSLVEVIVKSLIDYDLRITDAIYISSFQDIVTQYSTGHNNDPASFLEWWNARGKNISISVPEGMDAVQIMTIHKSKGLEFKCVIVPFATDKFTPSRSEWRWVTPLQIPGLIMPPVLPVSTDSNLMASIHQKVYTDFFDQVITDRLNMYYVAFTRARNELYVFSKENSSKNPDSLVKYLLNILKSDHAMPACDNEEIELMLHPDSLSNLEHEEGFSISYGTPFTKAEIEEENKKDDLKRQECNRAQNHIIKDYYVNSQRPRLRSLATKVTPSGETLS